MRRRPFACLVAALWLAACATARFDVPGAIDEADYAASHPYYAEYCALTQIKKKRGFGADIRGEVGGHAVFFLHGACLDSPGSYPVLHACEGGDGVGLSMNAHFRNAAWVGVPGRDFFFAGDLPPGDALDRSAYGAVKRRAEALQIYDAIQFNDWVFDDMPEGWDRRDWKYEVSAATDYGIAMGRGRYCARVPVDAAQMRLMVGFLNDKNAPYREGRRRFEWSVFNDNCIHLAHNALAAAGLWAPWPTERFLPVAVIDFPVPKNEFVNLMRRTNQDWLPDPGRVYQDLPARGELLDHGRLPTMPGALAEAVPPMAPNAVYDTDLQLIFYDEPLLGRYRGRFDRIFAEARTTQAAPNTAYFAGLARQAVAARRPREWWLAQAPYRNDPAGFTLVYDRFYLLMNRLAAS